jgi:RNA methyltransferase, TrmH family
MTKVITSAQNPLIKNIALLLEKARERRRQGLFVAEGLIELRMALQAGYRAAYLLYDSSLTTEADLAPLRQASVAPWEEEIQVNAAVMEKIAYRAGVPNAVGVFNMPESDLQTLKLSEQPLILVLESVEKPGNLGAILRTADAAGVDAVLLCDPQTDWYNPNVIRASLGAVFSLPTFSIGDEEALRFLQENNIAVLATHLEASIPYYTCDLKQPIALVMGTEAHGISDFWVQAAQQRIIIPMRGRVDSMNVSVSTAVVLFEALRQRSAY